MLSTFLLSLLLMLVCVAIHYEALYRFSFLCSWLKIKGRAKVVFGTIWAFFAHIIEVWIFGFGYYFLINFTGHGKIIDATQVEHNAFVDMLYFSFISYTSLGYGDIVPTGPVRFMAGTEALLGLVFIAWTASFLYLKMEQNWKEHD